MARVLEPVGGNRSENGRHHHGNANTRITRQFRAVKTRWRDPQDGHRCGVENDLLSNNQRIAGEPPLPVAVAQHGHGMPAGQAIVVICKELPQPGLHAKSGEVISRYQFTVELLALPTIADVQFDPASRQHSGKRSVLVANSLIHRVGEIFIQLS